MPVFACRHGRQGRCSDEIRVRLQVCRRLIIRRRVVVVLRITLDEIDGPLFLRFGCGLAADNIKRNERQDDDRRKSTDNAT